LGLGIMLKTEQDLQLKNGDKIEVMTRIHIQKIDTLRP
jgi:hypothetical protein